MKKIRLGQLMSGILTAAVVVSCTHSQPKAVLKDPVEVQGENFRGKPHYEVLIMNRNAEGPGGAGNYYNSLGLNFDVSNEEMDARFLALDPVKLKQEYGGDGVRFNGPRRFLVNRFSAQAFDGGKKFMMGPIPMYVYGTFMVPDFDAFIAGTQAPYRESVSKRSTTFYYDAGEEVYELVSPEGAVFTMFSASLRVDPNNTIDKLPTLGDRLTLPKGWKYRVRTLDKPLVQIATYDSDPPNTIVLDELENNYQRNRSAESKIAADSPTAPATTPAVLTDGDGAKVVRFENMHQTRFIELFFGTTDPKTGKLVAPCYNTMYTSDRLPASKDTAPQKLVAGLDLEKVAKDHGVAKVMLNGPKLWMPDWVEVKVGKERDFNGMTAGWCAQLNLPESGTIDGAPWKPMQIARTSKWAWTKGTKVALLDDAEGNTWILKGFQLGLKPQQTWEEFLAKGEASYKALPAGWKFRVKTLDKDVIEIPDNNLATIMTDELFHVWDKCGPGMTSYKP